MTKYYADCLLCKNKFIFAYWMDECEAYICLRHEAEYMLCIQCLCDKD